MKSVVWCTGAGKGIGRAVALRYAAAGWTVAASARSTVDLDSLSTESEHLDGTVLPFPVDVTDANAVADAVTAIEERCGPIDLAVLNAGTHHPTPATEFAVEPARMLVETNLMGTIHGLASVMPNMIARRRGHIAVVASAAGYVGLPTAAAYGATKAALINLCESLKPELDGLGVRLSLINPGFVRTPLTDRNPFPMPFRIEPDVAAERMYRGIERGHFEITFPRRFTWGLKVLRLLPYPLLFALTRRLVP